MVRDQDLLFGPAEAAATSSLSSELEAVRAELTRVQTELTQVPEQSQTTESAYKTRVAEEEAHYETAKKAMIEAQAKTQAFKNQIFGILLSCRVVFLTPEFFSLDCVCLLFVLTCFLFFSELTREKEQWTKDREEMKNTLRASENQAAEVRLVATSRLEEADQLLSLAMKIRGDVDRDVLQCMQTIRELNRNLEAANTRFESLWGAMQHILGFISEVGDDAMNLADYMPLIPSRFLNFVKSSIRDYVNHILCRVGVLSPSAP